MIHTLLNDWVFKIVFAQQGREKLLVALLNALLELSGEDRITTVTVLNPISDKDFPDARGVILDIKCRDGKGQYYNVEIQVASQPEYIPRILYYLATLYTGQLKSGREFQELARTISISLTDFQLFREVADLHSIYRLYDIAHQRTLSPDMWEFHFIELPKFKLDKPRALRSAFEKWLHCFKYSPLYENNLESLPPELKEEEGIAMALEAMRDAYATDEVRMMLEQREKGLHDEATRLEAARREGREAARLEMEQEREAATVQLEAAKAQLEREKEAAKAQLLRMACQLLASGMARAKVLEITQLPPEQIPE